ncbi:MAG: serine--tRNA ligase [Cryomorphaceae bacterium]|nr:serine--tRNA ligase [Cryomorphaceae bacterium]
MLTLTDIRTKRDELIEALAKRQFNAAPILDRIIELDEQRRQTQTQLDNLLSEANNIARSIGQLMKEGKHSEAEGMKVRTTAIKEESAGLKDMLNGIDDDLKAQLYLVPNAPYKLVPSGKSEHDNQTMDTFGEIPDLGTQALPHWELTQKYDLIDFELGTKITGAGFPVYKGKGARLQRALIQFFLDEANNSGYTEYLPPHMVNEDSAFGTGQLPDKEGQMYHDAADNLYLIPTAEVPLTNIYRDVLLKEDDFPIKMCGYTPCFRREAGSYGKDVRGLNRLHQFDKVEIVQIEHPDRSYETLEQMVLHVKGLLTKLELPYRTLRLCGGDMGFASAMTYDMEVYSTAQQRWLEVSSISNFETFQANRLKCRYKTKDGKSQLAHTLNGSALALPRIVAALLENHQTENGIRIPKALVPYTGFEYIN